MAQILFYVTCKENGHEEVVYFAESWVREQGGVDALEATISKDSRWYSPLGGEEVPSHAADPDNKESLAPTMKALLEAWTEKGAPTIQGAAAAATGSTSSTFTRKYFFYKYCDKDGLEQVFCQPEAQIQEYGGVEALESALTEQTAWFYPLGTLLFPTWVEEPGKGIQIPHRRIKSLVDAWLESGSPWKPGKFAQDLDAPPKGHPFDGE